MKSGVHIGMGILVIEDEPDVQKMISTLLTLEGYQVKTVANGNEAIRYLQGAPLPCLILLDLMMPVMDGWEFRKQLNKYPTLATIPVVLLSAVSDLQAEAASLKAAHYLNKPLDLGRLLDVVKQHC